jgi:hypothetical protein
VADAPLDYQPPHERRRPARLALRFVLLLLGFYALVILVWCAWFYVENIMGRRIRVIW